MHHDGPEIGREPHRWADEASCRDLVLRSAAFVDAGDIDALVALYAEDAELVRPSGQRLRGRDEIAQAYRDRPPNRITAHLVCGTWFDALPPGGDPLRATATSRVLLWTAEADEPCGPQGRRAAARQIVGSFRDRFVLTAQGWRLAARQATFDLFRD